MKEVKKCSISGIAFTLDNDAYVTLNGYLETLKSTYGEREGGNEIIADIEARIAELILSHQENTQIVTPRLVDEIIAQLGTAETIAEESDDSAARTAPKAPRIPRRLYRDTSSAKLGGVLAGIAQYFSADVSFVRLLFFAPLLLTMLKWFPFMGWTGPLMGNLFGFFVLGYLVMWLVVPAARTARQKLEMKGEAVTASAIGEQTLSQGDTNAEARTVMGNAVMAAGQIVLLLLKLFAGILLFGVIAVACGLIIGIFVFVFNHAELLGVDDSPVLLRVIYTGFTTALIPALTLVYVLFCLIASRKPSGRALLTALLLWAVSITAVICFAIRYDNREEHERLRNAFDNEPSQTLLEEAREAVREAHGEIEEAREEIEKARTSIRFEAGEDNAELNVDGKPVLRIDASKKGTVSITTDGSSVDVDYGDENYR